MTLAKNLRVTRLLHGALLGFALLVCGIAVLLSGGPGSRTDTTPVVVVLGVVSALEIGGVVVLRRKLLPPIRGGEPLDLDVSPGAKEQKAIARWQGAGLASWIVCETIVIYGLMSEMFTRELLAFAPFAIVGLGGLLAWAPSLRMFQAIVRGASW